MVFFTLPNYLDRLGSILLDSATTQIVVNGLSDKEEQE